MPTHLVFADERVRCDKVGILEWDCTVVKEKSGRDTKKKFGTVLSFSMGEGLTRRYKGDTTFFEPTESNRTLACKSDPAVLDCTVTF